ncbi:MAG: hypothetical protein ABSA21_13735 [Candidatus Limnocylindrales bacterium]|jgi:hypothetical protein
MEIHCLVQVELDHIPRGERASPQNEFRMLYEVKRLRGSKKGGSAQQALGDALDGLRRDHPDYAFQYDKAWFDARS